MKWLRELLATRRRIMTIHRIEKALGIHLTPWQRRYIFGESEYMPNCRACGRTTAHCIKICISNGAPIHMERYKMQTCFVDESFGSHYNQWFRNYLYETYKKLQKQPRLKLREIKF